MVDGGRLFPITEKWKAQYGCRSRRPRPCNGLSMAICALSWCLKNRNRPPPLGKIAFLVPRKQKQNGRILGILDKIQKDISTLPFNILTTATEMQKLHKHISASACCYLSRSSQFTQMHKLQAHFNMPPSNIKSSQVQSRMLKLEGGKRRKNHMVHCYYNPSLQLQSTTSTH